MGNAESNPVRNMDKRTARREYRDDFAAAIGRYRRRITARPPIEESNSYEKEAESWDHGSIRVCVRRRPIFKEEIKGFEFDVVTCIEGKRVVIHDARMHTDMKRQFINHHAFDFDRVFDEKCGNDEVYENTAAPLTAIAVDGGYATCLMYGQTGSGKTYTMSSIYERAARNIFETLEGESNCTVSLSFVEIAGDSCLDLLNAFQTTQLLTGRNGSVHPFPVVEPVVSNADELIAFINHGRNVRTTAATGVHDASSRSHAILRIYIQNRGRRGMDSGHDTCQEGTLTLVDLAGSEHKIDSMYHSAERRKEGAAINSSLMALKECIRARASGKDLNHYYRKSKLTMALKSSFANPDARTVVIVTVSPASKDTEHSLNSLRHACIMDGQDTTSSGETRFVTGGTTTVEQIGEIDITGMSKKALANKRAGGKAEDAKTSNGNTFGSDVNKEDKPLTETEKHRMRNRNERKAFAALAPANKALLKSARGELGQNRRQHVRLHADLTPTYSPRRNEDEVNATEAMGDHLSITSPRPSSGSSSRSGSCQQSHRQQPQPPYDVCFQLVEKKPSGISNTPIGDHMDHLAGVRPSAGSMVGQEDDRDMQEFLNQKMRRSPIETQGNLRRASVEAGPPNKGNDKPSRKSVKKLRAIIFCDDMAPLELKRRQFTALLRQNGYSKAEVERIMEKETSNDARADQISGGDDIRASHANTRLGSSNRIETQSAGSMRRNAPSDAPPPMEGVARYQRGNSAGQHPPPVPEPEPEPTVSRHEAAKLRRLKMETEAREKKERALSKKAQAHVISPEKIMDNEVDYASSLAALENELKDPSLTSASRHGIMKRIATLKSVHVREKRWKEQEKRNAMKYQQKMLQEAEAEKRRQAQELEHGVQPVRGEEVGRQPDYQERHDGATRHRQSNAHQQQDCNARDGYRHGGHGGGASSMTHTSMIESYLSPRSAAAPPPAAVSRGISSRGGEERAFSPLQRTSHHQQQQQHGQQRTDYDQGYRHEQQRYQQQHQSRGISAHIGGTHDSVQQCRGRERSQRDYDEAASYRNSRGAEREGRGYHGTSSERSDSLDRYINDVEASSQLPKPVTMPTNGDRQFGNYGSHQRRQQRAGYAAAPFANDMNWDTNPN